MSRPKKWRKVCFLPESNLFGPLTQKTEEIELVRMSVEEYETIRLIDLEGMNQESCADKMNVARSTIQRIYNDAKQKMADALVNGKVLKIEGGDYRLCEETEPVYGCGKCRRHRFMNEETQEALKEE